MPNKTENPPTVVHTLTNKILSINPTSSENTAIKTFTIPGYLEQTKQHLSNLLLVKNIKNNGMAN